MKIKTKDLIGAALDWAVVKSSGKCEDFLFDYASGEHREFAPSTKWSQGGPIIEREGLNIFRYNQLDRSAPGTWGCHKVVGRTNMRGDSYNAALCLDGPTPLIAAMRCYVASKLGDEIEVPDGLL